MASASSILWSSLLEQDEAVVLSNWMFQLLPPTKRHKSLGENCHLKHANRKKCRNIRWLVNGILFFLKTLQGGESSCFYRLMIDVITESDAALSNLYLHPCWSAVCPSRWIESWLVPDCGSPNKTSTIGVSNIIATTAAAKESAQFARAVVFASTADAKESAQFARTAVFATTAEAKYSAQFERAAVFASTAV
jgi:hypothetical protein